jgi:uncharacterized membrane protein YfcA
MSAEQLTELLPFVAVLLSIGAVAGVIAGLLGVGGGIVLVPAFLYCFRALGFDSPQIMHICLATSLGTIIFTAARSLKGHHDAGAVDWAVLRQWGLPVAAGALLGVLIADGLRTTTLMMIFGVQGILVGLYLAVGRERWRLGDRMPVGLTRGVTATVIGFLSVLMGIGGGSFAVPLMKLFGRPIHQAVGTASGFGLLIAVPSVLGFLLAGPSAGAPPLTVGAVNLPAMVVVIVATFITAPLGVRLAHRLDARLLRRIFAGFIFLVALNMLWSAW